MHITTGGLAYYRLDEYREAIDDYTEAIRLDPDYNPHYFSAYYNRGFAYYRLEEYEEAIDDYTQAIRLNPDYTDAYYIRYEKWWAVRGSNPGHPD